MYGNQPNILWETISSRSAAGCRQLTVVLNILGISTIMLKMEGQRMAQAQATDVVTPLHCHGMHQRGWRQHPRHSAVRRKVSCAVSGEHQNQVLWQQRRQLEALLRLSDPPHTAGDEAVPLSGIQLGSICPECRSNVKLMHPG